MKLEDLGYNKSLEEFRKEKNIDLLEVGRITLEHKNKYVVKNEKGELEAELVGNLRFTAESRYDLPAVGDWVAISKYDENKAIIRAIFPRHSIIERQAVGKYAQTQIIATNIDYGLIVQSVNRDFNINRLERYLTICNNSKVEPIVVLSKIDLIDASQLSTMLNEIKERINDVHVMAISNKDQVGLDVIHAIIKKGKTYCLLGSSGVGKSTLLNQLTGKASMKTGAISDSIDRGKHITTHRALIVWEKGGIIIDNPGMREIGIASASAGLEITFDDIVALSHRCKFNNCHHTIEVGCAIKNALESGSLDSHAYANFQKMEKERAFFESSVEEKKKKDKNLGKMIRNVQKKRKRNKF